MYVGNARGILVRHEVDFRIDTHALMRTRDLQLAALPQLGQTSRQPNMPAESGFEWTSVPMDPIAFAQVVTDAFVDSSAQGWDAAHAVVEHLRDDHASDETYAEPDFPQFAIPPELAQQIEHSVTPCKSTPGQWICMWPPHSSTVMFDWFLDKSGLRAARKSVEDDLSGDFRITVAHLDTGYNPKHVGLPKNMLWGLGLDFTSHPPDRDVSDPGVARPIISSPGHGTGTVCILAGSYASLTGKDLGGVPFAQILPVRISDYVWHIWTSVIPKGIKYAIANGAQVINLCHGGLPTRAWADAVNAAYEAGVVLCAATGDNFGGLPFKPVVWPARYPQAIGVAGVTFDDKPYYDPDFGLSVMEGNFGPVGAMGNVIAAYTPNLPWARCRASDISGHVGPYETDGYDLDGGGTSACTPQVSAAVALYMQKYWTDLKGMPGWQQIEVVRLALKNSARQAGEDTLHMGMGILDAEALLLESPLALQPFVKKLDLAEFHYAFLTHQPGWTAVPSGQQRMLEIELTHIALSVSGLWQAVNAWQTSGAIVSDPQFQKLRQAFLDSRSPRASKRLRDLLSS